MVIDYDFHVTRLADFKGSALGEIAVMMLTSKAGNAFQLAIREAGTVISWGRTTPQQTIAHGPGSPFKLDATPPPSVWLHMTLTFTTGLLTVDFRGAPIPQIQVQLPPELFPVGTPVVLGYALDARGPVGPYEMNIDNLSVDLL
jgi:hypothetical protein